MLEVRSIISRSLNKVIFLLLIGLLVIAGYGSPALSQMPDIAPNSIVYLTEADIIPAGTMYNVTVQISYNGGQLKSEGVRVYFEANDTSVIPVEPGTYVLTDKNGIANYSINASKTGYVELTAMAMSMKSGVSATKVFHVREELVATPTATPLPSPSPTPTPTTEPTANVTATPTAEPTPAATPTVAPTATAAPTSQSVDANAQAVGILTAGIVIAVILIVFVLVTRVFKKK